MRIATGALLGALTGFMAGLLAGTLSSATAAQAQATPAARASVPMAATTATDISAQRRRHRNHATHELLLATGLATVSAVHGAAARDPNSSS